MTHRIASPSLTAGAAIAAALAMSSTSAWAQDAAPVIDAAPVVESAPAAADPVPAAQPSTVTAPPPQIVLPPDLAAPVTGQAVTPAPVASPASTATAPARRTAAPPRASVTPQATQRTAPTESAAPAQASAVAENPAPVVAPLAAAPPAIAPAPAPAPVAETPAVAPADDGDNTLAIAAILAGLVGIGAAGTLAMRRRYRHSATAYEPAYEPASARAPAAEPVILPTDTAEGTPSIVAAHAVAARPVEVREYETAGTAERGWAVAQKDVALPGSHRTAATDLPDGPVPTGEARQQLLDRMVAAEPDEANPFTSKAARRKRARIILAAREHQMGEDTGRTKDVRSDRPLSQRQALPEPALA